MFDLPSTVIVSGIEYPVRTDYRVILEILVMLDDPELTDGDKINWIVTMSRFSFSAGIHREP